MGRGAPLTMKVGQAPAEFRAVVLALSRVEQSVRRDIGQRMRATMAPVWREAVTSHLTGLPMEARMLTPGTRIAGVNPPSLVAANSKRRTGSGGGLVPGRDWAGYEYGASRNDTSEVTRKGTTFKRHTKRHLPARRANGRVLGPAVREVLPRIASFWVQTAVKSVLDAFDRKS